LGPIIVALIHNGCASKGSSASPSTWLAVTFVRGIAGAPVAKQQFSLTHQLVVEVEGGLRPCMMFYAPVSSGACTAFEDSR